MRAWRSVAPVRPVDTPLVSGWPAHYGQLVDPWNVCLHPSDPERRRRASPHFPGRRTSRP